MVELKIQLPESFFAEEIRNEYLISSEMKKVWAVELDLLCELDRVCNKYNLRYFLDGGSLLGAVRHRGFIPWDDDIDVVMLREDYDRLLEVAKSEFQHPIFLQSTFSESKYITGHCQLRNNNTSAILTKQYTYARCNMGIFIDIFVLDGIVDDERLLKKQWRIKNRLKKQMSNIAYCYSDNIIKMIYKRIRAVMTRLFCGNMQKLYVRFEKCLRSCGDTKYVGLVSFKKELDSLKKMERKWYDQVEMLEFEGMYFPAPKEYEKVLMNYYGSDYMTPKNIPSLHNASGNMILSADESYLEVINRLKEHKK